jgi:hypothetical protein
MNDSLSYPSARTYKPRKDFLQMILRMVAGCILIVMSSNAMAQYNGHNLRGDFGMFSGSQPGPGFYAGVLGLNYSVDSLRNRNGDDLASGGNRDVDAIAPSDGNLDVDAIVPYFWWVSDKKVFGGNYSVFVSPSWTDNSLEAPAFGVSSNTDVGFGDLYVQPINLGWHTPKADFMAGLGVYAPTGRYSDGASDNTGLGMWSYEIYGGTTIYLDQDRTWSFAALAFYETHSSKEDSDVKVGDLLTIEGGLGKSWADGAAAFGLSYFAQWKLSEDDLGGGISNPNKHKIFGAGPELVLPIASKTKFYGTLNIRYLWDFSVESNTAGNTFILMATFPIPSISL